MAASPELRIIRPQDGSIISAGILEVEVRAFIDGVHIDHKSALLPILGRHPVNIYCGNKIVAVAKHLLGKIKGKKATFIARVDLSEFPEGTFRLVASMQLKKIKSKPKQVVISQPVEFTIDNSPPVIQSVFPSGDIRLEGRSFSRVIVELENGTAGIDFGRSVLKIDGKKRSNAALKGSGLVFPVEAAYETGIHKLNVTVYDIAGNKVEFNSTFEIIESSEKAQEEYAEEIRSRLDEKLTWDKKFQSRLFTDARGAFAEAKIPYTKAASKYLPPPIPGEQADFFTNVDGELASQTIAGLNQRVAEALGKRDNERVAKILERFGTGIVAENGGLTPNAIVSVSQMLQDPYGMLAALEIIPTEEEKKYIFPSFPKENADAFAEWISMTQEDNPQEISAERNSRMREISEQVSNDPVLLYKWLTNPKETFREFYPDATARDLLYLPEPLSDEEARQIINTKPLPETPPSPDSYHNSSDFVVAFSFSVLNKLIGLYFTTLAPGILPKTIRAEQTFTYAGVPANILSSITIDQPRDLQVARAATNTISLTASGNGSVDINNGTFHYAITFVCTPFYDIVLKDEKIYLQFNKVETEVTISGTGISDADAISTWIEEQVAANYPADDIYLADQKPIELPISFADVAVNLNQIYVEDAQDDFTGGDLYFGIGIDGEEYLFGEFEVDSGSWINLNLPGTKNNQFRLKKGTGEFAVSVRGVDLDYGAWPDEDDALGRSQKIHSRSAPGSYAMEGFSSEEHFEWVWAAVDTVLRCVCWVVDTIIWLINKCGELFGVEHLITWTCTSWRENIMGWIRAGVTENTKNYILFYDIVPLEPVTITVSLDKYFLTADALYLTFDCDIPGIADRKSKTSADNFINGADFGIALSENFMDKFINALWEYSTTPRTATSSFDSTGFYFHVDLFAPEITFRPDVVSFSINASGELGTNKGIAHLGFQVPPKLIVDNSLRFQANKLVLGIEHISVPLSNFFDLYGRLINGLADKFYNDKPENEKTTVVADLSKSLRAGVKTSDLKLNPSGALRVNEDELIMDFTMRVIPAIEIDKSVLDFTVGLEKTLVIKSAGESMLRISGISVNDNVFSIQGLPAMPFDMLPKDELRLTVSIDPVWTGMHSGALSISSNDPSRPTIGISLIAHDIPHIDATPAQLLFNGFVGRHSIVTIKNTGHGILDVTGVFIANRFFTVSGFPSLPFEILPQQQQVLSIDCTANDVQKGSLEIKSSDPDQPMTIITIESTAMDEGVGSSSGISYGGGGGY